MSRLCAKPTCSDPAVSWLDILRQDRRVIEHAQPSANGLAMCGTHRGRFVVPDGWEIVDLEESASEVTSVDTTIRSADAVVETAGAPTTSSREFPWFLAGANAGSAPVRPLLEADSYDDPNEDSFRAGSLLRRAFHGPDRDDDLQRQAAVASNDETTVVECADEDERYELETQRAMRALDDYGTAQLPFPPVDAEPRAAVS